ncbi:solute carrier family 52, riboflavin transporter, member 3-B-like [Leptopilina boulardi]|uniref:solute carrier family 52, riboflavin transporter, member 3-B-like n=1 Tax=Leptopilina boulardi TaxID=63433 RepID=UPI0021F58A2F|nr:solute carrier family 52, riboflavin transporter, member 3-B-like [Leptopilina boulardi]
MVKIILMKRRLFTNSLFVHILIAIFGLSAWLGINAIFVELPILVTTTKEWNLPMYIVIMVQVANIGPLSYVIARKFGFKFHESRWIFGMLIFSAIIMCLLAFFHEKTINFHNKEYNYVLFLVTFSTALINCSSSLLFMPYLRYFREIYLVSYFIGEGISGILPSIIALIQGTGNSQCDSTNNSNLLSETRFSSKYYFITIFILLLMSLMAFFLLETLNFVRNEKILELSTNKQEIRREIVEDEKLDKNLNIQKREEMTGTNDNDFSTLQREEILKNGEISLRVKEIIFEKKEENEETIVNLNEKNEKKKKFSLKIYLYLLLGVMCLLGNGFLPGIQSYSSLPYGNKTYHLTATLSQLANPIACFLVMLFPISSPSLEKSSTRLINCLSLIVFIICCYVIYLAFESPRPPLQSSVIGQVLVIISWILLIGLISYIKLTVTTIFRHESESENLLRIGVVMQIGSACGALVSLLLSSFTRLLNSYDSCATDKF